MRLVGSLSLRDGRVKTHILMKNDPETDVKMKF